MKRQLLPLVSALALLAACDATTSQSGDHTAFETVRVKPGQQSGTILVSAPTGATLPDWSGSSQYGLGYSPTVFHVITSSGTAVATGSLGSPVQVPHGTYSVVLNDTWTSVVVTARQTTEIKASRIEVADVSGTFNLTANAGSATYSGYNVLRATFPTGVGLNVIAGDFSANVSYQASAKTLSAKCDAGATALVQPADLRGNILVNAPTVALPDWSGSSQYGLGYDNSTFHVLAGATEVLRGQLGQSVAVPEGSYNVVLNDTQMTVEVTRRATTTLYAGRIEVDTTDTSGTFNVTAVAPTATYSGYNVLRATFPLGVGLDVLPGSYSVNVSYSFGGSDAFPITVHNQP